MKAKNLLLALAIAAWSSPAFADVEQQNYVEGFASSSTDITTFSGWGRIKETSKTLYYSYATGVTGGVGSSSIGYSGYQNSAGMAEPTESATIYNDLLVSPKVKGNVKFYFKRAVWSASFVSSIKVYACSLGEDGNYTQGDLIADFSETTKAATGTSWQTDPLTLSVEDYTYLGFRLEYSYIDEVSADYAMMPEKVAMSFTAALTETSNQPIYASDDGKFTVNPNIVITNDGNVPYPECSMTITPSFDNGADQAREFTIPEIAVGESYTFKDPQSYIVPEPTGSSIYTSFKLNVSINGSTKSTSYVYAYPYKAIPQIRHNDSSYSTGKVIDFDVFQGDRSREFVLKNIGSAPMVISSVDVPEGVEISEMTADKMPYTIDAGQEITETVTIKGDKAGDVEGTIVINFADQSMILQPSSSYASTFMFKGTVVPQDVYYVDFDDNKIPDGWYKPDGSNWSLVSDSSNSLYKGYCLQNGKDELTSIQSCKIKFEEGDVLTVYSAKQTASRGELAVQYSTDRVNWTEVADFKYRSSSDSDFPTSTKEFKKFTCEIPAGEYFINFLAGYVYLDHVYGGQKIDSAYDMAFSSAEVSSNPMVNHKLSINYSFYNIGSEIASGDYSVKFDDGKESDIDYSEAIASASSFSIPVEYTPHESGENIAHVLSILDKDGAVIAKGEVTFDVSVEKAQSEVVVGNATSGSSWIPFRPNFKYSSSEMVLEKHNNDEGDKEGLLAGLEDPYIDGLRYWYYNTNSDQTVSIKIWLQDTDDTTIQQFDDDDTDEFYDKSKMTLVYENDAYPLPLASSYQPINFMFTERFKHDESKNLRIRMDAVMSKAVWMTIGQDTANTIPCLYWYSDSKDQDTAKDYVQKSLQPAMTIISGKDAKKIAGKVYADIEDDNDNVERKALPGIEVIAYNPTNDVIYKAVSDENGAYALDIMQPELQYSLNATYERPTEYDPELTDRYSISITTYDYDSEENNLIFLVETGIDKVSVDTPSVEAVYYNLNGVKVNANNLTKGLYIRVAGGKADKVLVK